MDIPGSGHRGSEDTPAAERRAAPEPARLWRSDAALLVIISCLVAGLSGAVIFRDLGRASLRGDEGIYSVVARESVESGVWFPFQHADGDPYMDKPPVSLTILIVAFRFVGESEFVARFPSAVFGVLTIVLVFLVGARRFGVGSGVLGACLILGAKSYLVRHGVRDAVMDSLITLLALIVLVAWLNYKDHGSIGRGWWLASASAIAVASLTKHMLGIVFALIILIIEVLLWILRDSSTRKLLGAAFGLLSVAVLVTAMYVLTTDVLTGGLFTDRLYEDVVLRTTVGLSPGHVKGPLFYIFWVTRDFGWWLVFLAPAIYGAVKLWGTAPGRCAGHLLMWAAILVIGFSVSVSKLPWYIYPAYPALSLALAYGAHVLVERIQWRTAKRVVLGVIVVAAAVDVRESWLAVQRDTRVLDSQRFARVYSRAVLKTRRLEDSRFFVDAASIEKNGYLRSWDRFYLEMVPNCTWLNTTPAPVDPLSARCVFVATGNIDPFRRDESVGWRTIMKFRRSHPESGDIWIVGTCDLEVPGARETSPPLNLEPLRKQPSTRPAPEE